MKKLVFVGFSLVVAASVLSACGSGGEGTVAGIDRTGPPSASGASSFGTITGFGSIVVNGVRYETSGAVFTVDGVSGTEADLGVGDVVLVEGVINADGTSGTADTVTADDLVQGPVIGIDRTGGLLTMVGQTVEVSADTTFGAGVSGDSLDGLSIGDVVGVSGFSRAAGQIAATRIELKPSNSEVEVIGVVANLDASASTFFVNDQLVDFSAAQPRDFDSGSISNGDRVEAKGDLGPNGELLATDVEFKGGVVDGDEGDRLEVEGFITRFVSATDFDVATQPVTTNAQTVFEGGTEMDLGLNVKVEVEGDLDANGVLVASKVDIRRAKAVRITGTLDSVDAANDEIVILEIVVAIDALTRLEDKSDAELEPFSVADLNTGDYVEIRGSEDLASSADVIAALLEREDPDSETELQGFVSVIMQPAFEILGVTIETNASTVFRDENDLVLTGPEFFGRLGVGDLVKADGIESSSTVITASEVEFELE